MILSGHTDAVLAVALSPDGKTLASAGGALNDRNIRLWDVAGRAPRVILSGHTDLVRAVAFSPDGRVLASAGGGANEQVVRLWDVPGKGALGVPMAGRGLLRGPGPLERHADTGWVYSVAWRPDGRALASAGEYGAIWLWEIDADAWQRRACQIANRGLTRNEWEQHLGLVPFVEALTSCRPGPDRAGTRRLDPVRAG